MLLPAVESDPALLPAVLELPPLSLLLVPALLAPAAAEPALPLLPAALAAVSSLLLLQPHSAVIKPIEPTVLASLRIPMPFPDERE